MNSVTPQTDPSKKKTKRNKHQRAKAKRMSKCGGTWNLPERSAVCSLAEHVDIQNRADEKDKYVLTLPFDTRGVTVRKRAAILKRTKRRWPWFDKAKKLDTESNARLGTLGYLPQEIRDVIFQNVIDNHLAATIDTEHERHHGRCTVVDGSAYIRESRLSLRHFHYQSCGRYSFCSFPHGALDVLNRSWYFTDMMVQPWFDLKLRLASRTIQNQLDQLDTLWLSTSTIEFSCGNAWIDFFTKLKFAHHRNVRRVIIQILNNWHCCNGRCIVEEQLEARIPHWIEAFNETPSAVFDCLIDVKFHLGEHAHPRPCPKHTAQRYARVKDIISASTQTLHPLPPHPFRHTAVSHYPDVPVTELESVKKTLRFLAAAIRQRAPNAQIGLVEEYYLEEDVIAMKAALAGAVGRG